MSGKVEGKGFMGKTRENARRAAIFIAIGGFVFASVAGTLLIAMDSNKGSDTAQQQADLMRQIEEQQQAAQQPKEALPGQDASPFDAASVTELVVDVLQEGDGPAATAESTVSANYFGWTSDGSIFDSTNNGGTVTPIDFPLSGVIEGWTKGLTGIKQGSTVKLTIPGDMAYGNEDTGTGRPFGPLAFIVELKEVK